MSGVIPWRISNVLSRRPEQLLCIRRSIHSSNALLQAAERSKNTEKQLPKLEAKDQPLPGLNRPLGVRQRPTTLERTRTERMKDLLDAEARTAQRRHLVKEASKGYFHDMNMTRKHGGKTWIAPKVLIREDTHAKSFANSTYARYSSNPLFQYVQINLQENLLKSFLVKLFSNSLRSSVPLELQKNYLVSSQNMEYLRDPLGMTNSKVGYVYLIDENLKIRWGGCADATLREAQSLESCTGILVNRLEEKARSSVEEKAGGTSEDLPVEDASMSSTEQQKTLKS
ncbi:hypothetical protein NLJ89_g6914 [Agrocybe chaxingu]|uniref:Mitochondrial ATPase complex subunit ATP10 n=1 Tax=Agrocybe chaxingu TaxID=84603 RepID=A0A9W8JZZ7_9AGAR|nr:hypothetical protein NLJ89_g6914 [Agrocybe chaxingu]